jgi:LuxR family transcriptional regulator, maltose regulon positive regulatory protein
MLGNISTQEATNMVKNIPTVRQGILVDDRTSGPSIPLDSPAWFTWLEAATTTSFSYALYNRRQGYVDGFMTVRKERRQRGGTYWTAYRRQGHRLCKVYLGPSTALIQARLEEVATRLHARDGPPQPPELSVYDRSSPWRMCLHPT